MKGFLLDDSGDLVINGNDITMVSGADLTAQKIRQVLSTNSGEWWLDKKEGIPVQKLLKKNPDRSRIRDCLRRAVQQVDPALKLESCEFHQVGRRLYVDFTVRGGGEEINIGMEA